MGLPQELSGRGTMRGLANGARRAEPVEGLPGRAAFQRDPCIDDGPGGAVGAQGEGAGGEAVLRPGHVLMENRNGLVVDVVLSQATGTAANGSGADDAGAGPHGTVDHGRGRQGVRHVIWEFVTTCRSFEITPHVAMKQRRIQPWTGGRAVMRGTRRVSGCGSGSRRCSAG